MIQTSNLINGIKKKNKKNYQFNQDYLTLFHFNWSI